MAEVKAHLMREAIRLMREALIRQSETQSGTSIRWVAEVKAHLMREAISLMREAIIRQSETQSGTSIRCVAEVKAHLMREANIGHPSQSRALEDV